MAWRGRPSLDVEHPFPPPLAPPSSRAPSPSTHTWANNGGKAAWAGIVGRNLGRGVRGIHQRGALLKSAGDPREPRPPQLLLERGPGPRTRFTQSPVFGSSPQTLLGERGSASCMGVANLQSEPHVREGERSWASLRGAAEQESWVRVPGVREGLRAQPTPYRPLASIGASRPAGREGRAPFSSRLLGLPNSRAGMRGARGRGAGGADGGRT